MLLYEIVSYIGYFLVMIIFMVIAIARAKRKRAWIWYGIGAVLQLMALLGNQKFPDANGNDTIVDWMVFIGLLIVSALLMKKRYNKAQEDAYVYENTTDESDA